MRRYYVALMQGNVPNYGDYLLGFTNFQYDQSVDEFVAFHVAGVEHPWCRFDNLPVRFGGSPTAFLLDMAPLYETSPVDLEPSRWFFKKVTEAEYKNGIFLMKLPEFVTLSDG